MITSIIDVLREKFLGKTIKISGEAYIPGKGHTKIKYHSGVVKHIDFEGDKYAGYESYFHFDDGFAYPVDFYTEIEIIE